MMGTASNTAADALGYFKKAVAIWQKLAAPTNPTDTEYQKALAAGHFNLAAMFVDTGHTNEAMESEQEALVIRQKLADENPSIPQYQNELARSLHNFANLLRATGQRGADALEFLKKAGAIWQKLSDANPTVTEYEHALATVYFNVGWMHSEAGQNGEALAIPKEGAGDPAEAGRRKSEHHRAPGRLSGEPQLRRVHCSTAEAKSPRLLQSGRRIW